MPYIMREPETSMINTVFDVEKSAISDIKIPAFGIVDDIASASGAFDAASLSEPTMATADTDTSMYSIVDMTIESINALGITFLAFFVSSDTFAMSSKPMYAKNIRAVADMTPAKPFFISKKSVLVLPDMNIAAAIMRTRPETSIKVETVLNLEDSFMP